MVCMRLPVTACRPIRWRGTCSPSSSKKSEKRIVAPDGVQGTLGDAFDAVPGSVVAGKKTRVAGHERIAAPKRPVEDESTLFFDENKVPVEIIQVANTESEGLDPEDYEVIGERVSHRLAQRPGS